jgi:hypothetical protein
MKTVGSSITWVLLARLLDAALSPNPGGQIRAKKTIQLGMFGFHEQGGVSRRAEGETDSQEGFCSMK